MKSRVERLQEVYAYVRRNKGVFYQKDFALAVGVQRPVMSAALNGNEAYLTDSLFRKICKKYPEINIDYLLSGNGEMMNTYYNDQGDETASLQVGVENLLTIAVQIIKENEALRRELREDIETLRSIIDNARSQPYTRFDNSQDILKIAEPK